MKSQIGIIGGETKNIPEETKKQILSLSYEVGKLIAEGDAVLITGGCTGVAEAACKGSLEKGGITVGTPGPVRGTSVNEVQVEICTPIGTGDYLFAGILSCDSIICLPGGPGTLAELMIAYRYKKPLIFIKGYKENILKEMLTNYDMNYPAYVAENAKEAVKIALEIIKVTNTPLENSK